MFFDNLIDMAGPEERKDGPKMTRVPSRNKEELLPSTFSILLMNGV